MSRRRVLPFGKSLLIGVVSKSLQSCSEMELLPPTQTLTEQDLTQLAPEVILYDLEIGEPESTLQMLEAHPGLCFIGLGPSHDQVLVLSSRQQRAIAMSDLERVILVPSESAPASDEFVSLPRLPFAQPDSPPCRNEAGQGADLAPATAMRQRLHDFAWANARPPESEIIHSLRHFTRSTFPPFIAGVALGALFANFWFKRK